MSVKSSNGEYLDTKVAFIANRPRIVDFVFHVNEEVNWDTETFQLKLKLQVRVLPFNQLRKHLSHKSHIWAKLY